MTKLSLRVSLVIGMAAGMLACGPKSATPSGGHRQPDVPIVAPRPPALSPRRPMAVPVVRPEARPTQRPMATPTAPPVTLPIQQPMAVPTAPALTLPAQQPVAKPMALPAPQTLKPNPVSTKLSFDLFGHHKEYNQVTAMVAKDEQGREQTVIQARDGDNTLKLVVAGSGVGEHKLVRAEIKDQLLGAEPYVLDASNPKIAGTVTFTEFDPQGGRVVGSFDGGYTGFPPVRVSNGALVAWHGGNQLTTAGAR